MPRFFLDVLHGRRVCEDPEGQDFIDLDAARAEAVASAQYLVAHGILRNEDVSDRSFLIRDEDEQTVATMPFRDSLPGTLSGGADQLASLGTGLERLVSEHDKALGKGERYVRDLIEALPAAIYMTDAQGRITYYNEAAVAFAGRRPALGQDRWCVTWRLYQPDGTLLSHDQCPMAIALKENRPIRGVEAVAERPNGTRVSFMPFPTPLHDASGALVGGVNMLVETTHHGRAEDRIGPH
jgi:PAS domain S-box-containing protein